MAKQRLDEALAQRQIAESRSQARALILAGDVLVNGERVSRAGVAVGPDDLLSLVERARFVSRGGEKLAHALRVFEIDVVGRVAADVGASTGGFTDCLLQAGARRVMAIDVGYGLLHRRVAEDQRVVVLDRTNVRHLGTLPEQPSIVTIDVSFISLSLVLPVVSNWLELGADCVPLVKPQFEAGRSEVGKGGVVRDANVHRRVLQQVGAVAEQSGFGVVALTRSPLTGPAGNVEYLAHLVKGSPAIVEEDEIDRVVGAITTGDRS